MNYTVTLVKFGKGQQRIVTVPDTFREPTLNNVFYYGQNDFQPQDGLPSVSVGDIINFNDSFHIVCGQGFKELTISELNDIWIAIDFAKTKEAFHVEFDNYLFNLWGKDKFFSISNF